MFRLRLPLSILQVSQPCLLLADIGCDAGSDAGCEGSAKGSGLMQSHKPTRFQKKIGPTSARAAPQTCACQPTAWMQGSRLRLAAACAGNSGLGSACGSLFGSEVCDLQGTAADA